MSTQHTPTPLSIGKPSADLPNFVCIRGSAETGAWSFAWTADRGAAEAIVRACNSHDALVAALHAVVREGYDHNRRVREQARAALAAATE